MPDLSEEKITYTSGEYYRDVGLTRAVLDSYNESDRQANLELRSDVACTVHDFTSNKLYGYVQQAAELIDIFDRLNNTVKGTNARRAIQLLTLDKEPLGNSGYTHGDYLLAIADDVPVINDFSSQSIDRWARSLRQKPDPFDREVAEALDADNNHQPAGNVWLRANMPYDKKELADLAEDISLETVLIKSCQILTSLRNPEIMSRQTNTDQLRTIMMTESVYIPLCDVLGYDALSAALYDSTSRLRLINAGRQDLVDRAQQIRDQAGNFEALEATIPEILEAVCGEFVSDPVIRNGATNYNILSKEGIVVPVGSEEHFRIVLRLKSVGSLARKLLYYEGKDYWQDGLLPADVLGATIITDYAKQIGPVLATTQQLIDGHPKASAIAAPGRIQNLHIRGPNRYVKKVVRSARQQLSGRDIDIKLNDGDFKVAKTTFAWRDSGISIPIEIQILDAEARAASRYGKEAHFNHKNSKYNQGYEVVDHFDEEEDNDELTPAERIHRRISDLDKDNPGILRRSLERSRRNNRRKDYGSAVNRAAWT